ncbi:hypothetical protein NUW58_g6818 [Xylaria curta]|uniref:Uncharacterized protein n=1 Tax=Xylaria curta TaxID=42375 RepID=A0ACC1NP91_9PEZI|nr:hypothetical protein NUW58_g6818 [Xylaria curta]
MSITQASQAALFTRLPVPKTNPPQLPSGTVSLYKDPWWTSDKLDLRTSDYVPNVRHRVQSALVDSCSYIAFNLPAGTVMTLMDHVVSVSAGENTANLKHTGASVDLVGVGYTVGVDLMAYGLDDMIASFFWRTVDLTRGAFELFIHPNFTGIRGIVFLAEFQPGVIHDIQAWSMNDSASSVRWKPMVDRQTAALFAHPDGSGESYRNMSGSITTKEASNLADYGFDDTISSFRWDTVVPVKEIIEPFNVTAASAANSGALSSTVRGTNRTSLPQAVTVSLDNTTSQTVTVSTQDQFVTGVSTTLSISNTVKGGVPGAVENETTTSWSVTVNFEYTQSTTHTTSTTKTIDLNIQQQVTAPPNTNYTASLLVSIGQLPPTIYKTTATRWYNVPMVGAQQDPTNNNWYKRTEEVDISMTGALAASTWTEITATPL